MTRHRHKPTNPSRALGTGFVALNQYGEEAGIGHPWQVID